MAQAGGRAEPPFAARLACGSAYVNSAHRHRSWWGKWGDGRFALTLPKGRFVCARAVVGYNRDAPPWQHRRDARQRTGKLC